MEVIIKAAGAYFSPEGVVADNVNHPQFAQYNIEQSENTYNLYVTSELAPAAVSLRIPVEIGTNDTIFMNGFQSATESREHTVNEKMRGIDVISSYARALYAEKVGGDYSMVKYKNIPYNAGQLRIHSTRFRRNVS